VILCDEEIKEAIAAGDLAFSPALAEHQIQTASVDLRLSEALRVPKPLSGLILSPNQRISAEHLGDPVRIPSNGYILAPSDFVLGATLESVRLPLELAARLEGKSSIARVGLVVHITSAHIAPGFNAPIVLEIVNLGKNSVALVPGMFICQLIIERLSRTPGSGYSGRFQGQTAP